MLQPVSIIERLSAHGRVRYGRVHCTCFNGTRTFILCGHNTIFAYTPSKANASSLLAELHAGDLSATRQGLGGLLELVRRTPDDVVKLPDLEQKLDKVVKSYPGDVQILSEVYNLLNMKEETVPLSQKPQFKYPPFQKALPYFPSNCFQLLLKFQGQLTSQLHRQIMDVLQALKGEVLFIIPKCYIITL